MSVYLNELHDLDVVWEGDSTVLEQQCSDDTCATAVIVGVLEQGWREDFRTKG